MPGARLCQAGRPRRREDRPLFGVIHLSIGPGDLDQWHERQCGERVRADPECHKLVEEDIIRDMRGCGERSPRRTPLFFGTTLREQRRILTPKELLFE